MCFLSFSLIFKPEFCNCTEMPIIKCGGGGFLSWKEFCQSHLFVKCDQWRDINKVCGGFFFPFCVKNKVKTALLNSFLGNA